MCVCVNVCKKQSKRLIDRKWHRLKLFWSLLLFSHYQMRICQTCVQTQTFYIVPGVLNYSIILEQSTQLLFWEALNKNMCSRFKIKLIKDTVSQFAVILHFNQIQLHSMLFAGMKWKAGQRWMSTNASIDWSQCASVLIKVSRRKMKNSIHL